MSNRRNDSRHNPFSIPDIRGKVLSLSPLSMMSAVEIFSQCTLLSLRKFPSIPRLFRVFCVFISLIMNGC